MSEVTIQQAFELAVQHHQAGRLKEAESIYRQILTIEPRQVDSLHMLGVIASQIGRNDVAIELIRRAIAIKSDFPQAYCNLGIALQSAGKCDEAIAAYQQALFFHAADPFTHNSLGNAFRQKGHLDEAIAEYRQALNLKPDYAEAHGNLGNTLGRKGDLEGAAAACLQALSFKPDYPDALNDLGTVLRTKGKFEEAMGMYRKAIALMPDYAEAHNNLGNALRQSGKLDESIAAHHKAIALNPHLAAAHNDLGIAYFENGQLDQAMTAYQQAIALNPAFAEAYSNLGIVLDAMGLLAESIAAHRRASVIRPDYFPALNNLGNALREDGQLDEALAAYRKALLLKPESSEIHLNSGNALREKGMIDEAMAAYRKAITLTPDSSRAHSNLAYCMNFPPAIADIAILEEHRRWSRQHADPLRPLIQSHNNDKDPERKLRVGYVSSDFRAHSVAFFFENLLAAHDRSQWEVYCYSHVIHSDAVTARLQGLSDHWRRIIGLSDPQVADLIRTDGIDILVDLAGHTAGNRLTVFARKPAPIQVTWLGYPNTTGLDTIDYRITDAFADPPGSTEHLHSETLFRMPHSAWCYRPSEYAPPVSASPVHETDHITFGSFNALPKINSPLLELWAKILHAVPGSRLRLKNAALGEHSVEQELRKQFQQLGIDPQRVETLGRVSDTSGHLAAYGMVDIALDTFPYHGTTTTCEALWMGVPVVTLAGKTHVSRVGVSLLTHLGHPEWIAASPEEYVKIATDLANDRAHLSHLRATLRNRMQSSPLMDATSFARDMEDAYRNMWQTWCEKPESKHV